jgi:hypothetical protein
MRINRDSIHPARHRDDLRLVRGHVEIRVIVGEGREISELLRSWEIEPSTSTFETIMDGDDLIDGSVDLISTILHSKVRERRKFKLTGPDP